MEQIELQDRLQESRDAIAHALTVVSSTGSAFAGTDGTDNGEIALLMSIEKTLERLKRQMEGMRKRHAHKLLYDGAMAAARAKNPVVS